jgi:2-dehydro-3-deoxyphosphogluconate aldolase/(4S)-4-hydroxy-2-oxoglutarate aldolase
LGSQRVLPLVEVDDGALAVALARVLIDGGLPVMEIALRTAGALAAIEAVRSSVPDAVVGAGTVMAAGQLSDALAAGAVFAVSPGSSDALMSAAVASAVPFVPGIATVTELMRVIASGCREVKFFPAEASGGVATLSSLAAVAPSARFLPTGGIDVDSAPGYLAFEQVFAVGGSWVCPAALIRDAAWEGIAERVGAASRLTTTAQP